MNNDNVVLSNVKGFGQQQAIDSFTCFSAWGPSRSLTLRKSFLGDVPRPRHLDYRHISARDYISWSGSRPYIPGERVVLPDGTVPAVPGGHNYVVGYVGFYEGGARVRAAGSPASPPRSGGGPRGEVRGMSRNSQRRLRDRLLTCAWYDYLASGKRASSGRAAFLTLTYPGEWSEFSSWSDWKSHLRRFRERLARSRFRPEGVVWKLEFQQRGAPHFHLVLWWSSPVDFASFRRWSLAHWSASVSAEDDHERAKHARWGADVRPLYGSARGAQAYLSKYVSKGNDVPDCIEGGTGRCWGVWWSPPDGHVFSYVFHTEADFYTFLRRVRRWGRANWFLKRFRGGRVYSDGVRLLQLMRGLTPSLTDIYSQSVDISSYYHPILVP